MDRPIVKGTGPFGYLQKFRNFIGFVNKAFGLSIDPTRNLYVYLEERMPVHPGLEFNLIPENVHTRIETYSGHVFMVNRSDDRDREGDSCTIS